MFSFRHIFSKTLLIFFVSFPFSTRAKVVVSELLSSLPVGASVSVIAKNLDTGQIIAEHQSQAFMLPASTQKVLTALAAKLALPDDFRFQTAFLSKGNIENGILKEDLIAKFTGDPTLSSLHLTELVEGLKKKGVRQITGNLILDTSVFTSHNKASGWVWNDLSLCFSAQPSAVNIDHNCFYANLDANQPTGSLITVSVPSEYPVQVFSSAYVVENAEASYCLLDAVMSDNNRYHIKGCLARQVNPFSLSFAVQDPTAYGASMIQAKLKRSGIQFSGQIQIATKPQSGKLLAEHYSDPLPELIKKMMKKSDNQIADTLFRAIANQYYKRSASFPLASQALRDILKKQESIDLANGVIVDGSGLSRHNLMNAQTMLDVLTFIAKNEDQLHLFETFPIAGVDGTLAGRGSVTTEPLANNLIAKTGALKGVYNLAGFMKNARGERITFVEFINGYSTSQHIESKTKRAPLNQFENALFMSLYNE